MYALERIDLEIDGKRLTTVLVVLISAVMLLNGSMVAGKFAWSAPVEKEFLDEVSGLEGVIASNDPRVNVYGDFEYMAVPPAKLREVWQDRNKADYFAINTCQWYCSNVGPGCEEDIDWFESKLDQLEKQYEANSNNCSYSVYRVEK